MMPFLSHIYSALLMSCLYLSLVTGYISAKINLRGLQQGRLIEMTKVGITVILDYALIQAVLLNCVVMKKVYIRFTTCTRILNPLLSKWRSLELFSRSVWIIWWDRTLNNTFSFTRAVYSLMPGCLTRYTRCRMTLKYAEPTKLTSTLTQNQGTFVGPFSQPS